MRASASATGAATAQVRSSHPSSLSSHAHRGCPFLAGGADMRTSEYRQKKQAPRALELTEPTGLPLATAWPSDEQLDTMILSSEQAQELPVPAGTAGAVDVEATLQCDAA